MTKQPSDLRTLVGADIKSGLMAAIKEAGLGEVPWVFENGVATHPDLNGCLFAFSDQLIQRTEPKGVHRIKRPADLRLKEPNQ